MKSKGTPRVSSALRAAWEAARALPTLRKPFREEMRRRAAVALDGLGESQQQLGELGACDPKRAARWRDDSTKGIAAPWWFLAVLPPTKFRAALAHLEEWHRELYGDEATRPSREDLWFLASESMSQLTASSSRALKGDQKICDEEVPDVLPDALTSYRRLRAFIVACGHNPDAEGT